MATYSSWVPADILNRAGYLVKPEYNVMFGGTLSATYVAPGVSIGSTGGANLGLLDGLSFNINSQINPITGSNIAESGLVEISTEECLIDITLKEWSLEVLKASVVNGNIYDINGGDEVAIGFGGGSRITYQPLVLYLRNTSANKPTSEGLLTHGITGMIATFYKTVIASPLNFDQLQATENKPLSLQFRAVRDSLRVNGAQTGVLYLW